MAKSGKGGFKILVNTMTVGIEVAANFDDEVQENLRRICESMVLDAQQGAPWNDITGQAREELNADVDENDGIYTVTLAHGVEYGQWLETIQSGKFAILMPTLESWADRILEAAGHGVVREKK